MVLLHHLVFGHDELPIPCGVGGVKRAIEAAAAGRVGQANAGGGLEHENVDEVFEMAVVKGPSEAHAAVAFKQCVAAVLSPG